jgi:hypothetical protein
VLTFLANTVITNAVVLLFTGSLTGRVELNAFVAIRAIGAILAIVAMIFVAKRFLPAKHPEPSILGVEPTDAKPLAEVGGSQTQDDPRA